MTVETGRTSETLEENLTGAGVVEDLVRQGRVPFLWDVKNVIGVYFHNGPGMYEKASVFIVPPSGARIGDRYQRDGYAYEFFDNNEQSLGRATSVYVSGSDTATINRRIDRALEEIDVSRRNPSLRDRVARRQARLYREIVEPVSNPHS
jgi:hypothetical protein